MLFPCVLKGLTDKISNEGYFLIDLQGRQAL